MSWRPRWCWRCPWTNGRVKVSDGPPDDADEDLGEPVWAGVVPVVESYGPPVVAPGVDPRYAPPSWATLVTLRDVSFWMSTVDPLAPRRPLPGRWTPTWRSSAPATPGCGRRTTWPRPTRRCASWCWSGRSPGSAPRGATAAGARRCCPASLTALAARHGRDAAIAFQRAMNDTVDEVGPGRRGRGHRLPLRQGRHGGRWRARRCSWAGRAARGRGGPRLRARPGPAVRGRGVERAAAPPACSAATYTPHCAAIHPARLVRGLAEAVERRGVHDLRADAGDRAATAASR